MSNAPEEGYPTNEITPVDLHDKLIIHTASSSSLIALAEKMRNIHHPDPYILRAFRLSAITLAGVSSGNDNGEFRGIKTTISKAFKSFKSRTLAKSVSATNKESNELIEKLFRNNRYNNDLFISFPQSEMKLARVWLRLILTAFIRDNIKTPPSHPVLFLLDEFPQLGTFNLIKDNAAFLRGYHVRFWFIGQNIAQFEANYGKEGMQTIFENCTVKQFFNVTDATARYVSQKMGKQTVVIKNLGTMEYKSTYAEDVMSQTEIEQSEWIINFIGNNPAFLTKKRAYFDVPQISKNALPNPLIAGLDAFKNSQKNLT